MEILEFHDDDTLIPKELLLATTPCLYYYTVTIIITLYDAAEINYNHICQFELQKTVHKLKLQYILAGI